MQLSQPLAALAEFLFPARCPLCGESVGEHGGLCPDCWLQLAIPGEPSCRLCQRPFTDSLSEDAVCAPCMADPPQHSGIAAATIYNDPVRKLILTFKNSGRISLAPLFARMIGPRLPVDVGPDWLLVPVPLHRWRIWRRGYNQSALLARELGAITGARVLPDGLRRRRHTPTLAGKGRSARARILSGAIEHEPRRRAELAGARVVLVDDVLTSGATSNACIRALKRAGVREVIVACIARVLNETLSHE